MSELEKKFYEYFMSEYFNPKEPEKIAHDLAEIAEKELLPIKPHFEKRSMTKEVLIRMVDGLYVKREQLQKENAELGKQLKRQKELYLDLRDLDNKNLQEIEKLKKQIENIKYLDRNEVNKILINHFGNYNISVLNSICSLAIPTREKIIEKLKHLKGAGFILGEVDDNMINFILGDDVDNKD